MNKENTREQNIHIANNEHDKLLGFLEASCSDEALNRFKEEPYQMKYKRKLEEMKNGKSQ